MRNDSKELRLALGLLVLVLPKPPFPRMVGGKEVVVCNNGVVADSKMNWAILSPDVNVIGVLLLFFIRTIISPR